MPLANRNFPGAALGAIVALALAADALAAPRDRFPIDLEALRSKEAAAFAAADANGDGTVSAAEFAASDGPRIRQGRAGKRRGRSALAFDGRNFDLGDADDDGAIGRILAAHFDSRNFDLGDADGDGVLSREEFEGLPEARRAARAQRMFEGLDDDGDGALAEAEFPSRAKRLAALDADGDGMLTREEMRQGRRR